MKECYATLRSKGKCHNQATLFYKSLWQASNGITPKNRVVCTDCAKKLSFEYFTKVGSLIEISEIEFEKLK